MTIGQRIAHKRREQGLSQEALGERLGVSRQSVYKWESDTAVPEIDKLIAMSRLFAVTVGWLLGVEESESAGEERGPAGEDGELTETQLKMVEEIVSRYIAAQPRAAKKKRWPRVLAAAAAVAMVWTTVKLNGELNVLNSRYNSLQNSISNVSSSVNSQINGIADRVEEVLQSQNSLLANYTVEPVGADLRQGTLTLRASVTPKTYTEGMRAVFLADTGSGPVEYPAGEGVGRSFNAEIVCDLTDTTTVSVVFISGDVRQTQIVYARTDLLSGTFPRINFNEHILMWKALDDKGTLVFTPRECAWYTAYDDSGYGEGHVPRAKIKEVKVGLFNNRELVTWMTPLEGIPDNYQGFTADNRFYAMPELTLPVEEGDILCFAALVIDEYDRQRLYPDVPHGLDAAGKEMEWADSAIAEKEAWYDTANWIY